MTAGLKLVFGLLICLAAAVTQMGDALANERITNFNADLTIAPSGIVTITETITVEAEGIEIRRGIFRDIPTTYRAADKSVYEVELKVLSVERDGRPEPYTREKKYNGISLRIGDADIFLERGPHTYRVTYTAKGVLGFFESHDELYWNVTGTGWPFAIDSASATLTVPAGATITGFEAFTGSFGAAGKDFQTQRRGDNVLYFTTTRPLAAGEGLTIVAGWPKGFVAAPTAAQKAQRFLRQNLSVLIALIGFFGLLFYYLRAWIRVGRDPPPGTVIPRFEPPKGMGPAAVRFVRRMGYDRKALTAALVNIAARGAIKIADDGRKFRLERLSADIAGLSAGEKEIVKVLFAGGNTQIELDNENHKTFSSVVNRLRNSLVGDYERAAFLTNQAYFWVGVLITALVAGGVALVSADPGTVFILMIVASGLFAALASIGNSTWTRLQTATSSFGEAAGKLFSGVAGIFAFVFMSGGIVFISAISAEFVSLWTPALLGGSVVLNFLFFSLMKAPTLAGRKLMDEIEGFRLYLSVAEGPRLDAMTPPQMTPEEFEKNLGYAIALDVESEWSERFEASLARSSAAPDERGGYRPSFYSGSRLNRFSSAGFGGALGSAMSSAIASAATAPGSSSGMGGGGFSGGGGGGGGGGGW